MDSKNQTRANLKKYIKVAGKWRFVPVLKQNGIHVPGSGIPLYLAMTSQAYLRRSMTHARCCPATRRPCRRSPGTCRRTRSSDRLIEVVEREVLAVTDHLEICENLRCRRRLRPVAGRKDDGK